jgi:glycosyltransferase involved in cell wall biosynthesis
MLGLTTTALPLAMTVANHASSADRVAFIGNLFYEPNHEAALWICRCLVPKLRDRAFDPSRLVIAGRRPRRLLIAAAAAAGVELRPDVEDLGAVVAESAVVLAPMELGSGVQYKILDATGAGRPCVITPVANRGLGLEDEVSALVRERRADAIADAITTLLSDPRLRERIAAGALDHLHAFSPAEVAEAWRRCIRPLMSDPSITSGSVAHTR